MGRMRQKWLGYAALAAGVAASALLAGVPAVGATVTCGGRTATIVGTAGGDVLTGTKGPDVIAALGGDDRIDGRGGADLICAGDGADVVSGGGGADKIYGGRDRWGHDAAGSYLVGDVLDGGPGDDWLDPTFDSRSVTYRQRPDTFTYADAGSAVAVDLRGTTASPRLGVATGAGTDTLVLARRMRVLGSAHADQLTGSAGSDEIVGGAGSDVISAGDGDDLVFPDEESVTSDVGGNDIVRLGPGRDFASSLAGRDQISGGSGADRVEALSPEPTSVQLGGGDDYLAQVLVPGHGASLSGGDGRDLLMLYAGAYARESPVPRPVVDAAAGTVRTPESAATLAGFESYRLADAVPWRFVGSSRAETLWVIDGGGLIAAMGGGNDRVTGSPYDDRINGGPGRDTANGGGGDDTCSSVEAGSCR